ncbi:MAG: heme ABC exporter ATP-binding protein CcmA [Acidimicrobiales bacterium]
MDAIISLKGISALASGFPALAGVDLDVFQREIVLLQGPNGAGKTSILRVCAGLLPAVTGSALVLGCDLRKDRRSVRRHIGLVGHTGFLYDDLTAEENVRFAVRASGAQPGSVPQALERLGVSGRLLDTRVDRLSAGQRRRVVLATLLARSPLLWLLDEPHAGLDANGRDLLDEIVCEARSHGATVVIASHEGERSLRLVDRVITVAGGQVTSSVAAHDDPGCEPASEFAARVDKHEVEPEKGLDLPSSGEPQLAQEPVHVA